MSKYLNMQKFESDESDHYKMSKVNQSSMQQTKFKNTIEKENNDDFDVCNFLNQPQYDSDGCEYTSG